MIPQEKRLDEAHALTDMINFASKFKRITLNGRHVSFCQLCEHVITADGIFKYEMHGRVNFLTDNSVIAIRW